MKNRFFDNPFVEKVAIFLSGVVNGLFGGGGGMLLMPLLLKRSTDAREAHALSPAVILPLSLCSAAVYLVRGETDWDLLWKCALGLTAGALVGAFLLPKIQSRWLTRAFALLVIIAAIRGLFS